MQWVLKVHLFGDMISSGSTVKSVRVPWKLTQISFYSVFV